MDNFILFISRLYREYFSVVCLHSPLQTQQAKNCWKVWNISCAQQAKGMQQDLWPALGLDRASARLRPHLAFFNSLLLSCSASPWQARKSGHALKTDLYCFGLSLTFMNRSISLLPIQWSLLIIVSHSIHTFPSQGLLQMKSNSTLCLFCCSCLMTSLPMKKGIVFVFSLLDLRD